MVDAEDLIDDALAIVSNIDNRSPSPLPWSPPSSKPTDSRRRESIDLNSSAAISVINDFAYDADLEEPSECINAVFSSKVSNSEKNTTTINRDISSRPQYYEMQDFLSGDIPPVHFDGDDDLDVIMMDDTDDIIIATHPELSVPELYGVAASASRSGGSSAYCHCESPTSVAIHNLGDDKRSSVSSDEPPSLSLATKDLQAM